MKTIFKLLLAFLTCLTLQGCERVYDPVFYNDSEVTAQIAACLNQQWQENSIPPHSAWCQGEPGVHLSGLQITKPNGSVVKFSAAALDKLRSMKKPSEELWVIGAGDLTLHSLDEISRLRRHH